MSQFPTHPNREFFAALQGIKSSDQGNFRPDQGIPLSSAIWGRPDRPIRSSREISNVAEKQRGTPPDARVAEGLGMRKSLAELRDARLAVPGLRRGGVGQVARREASSVRELGSCRGKLIVNIAISFLTMTKAN